MIELDGSYGEGGGQILRTALAFSTITQKPFKIDNIRKGRCTPGIKNQHLYCVKALEKMSLAKAVNAKIGSESLTFIPGKLASKHVKIDVGTAGSVTLLLQSVLLPCLKKRMRFTITGGTDVKWSMPIDYLKEIVLPQYKRYADITCKLLRRGYYPKGGGKIEIIVKPVKNEQKVNLMEQGKLVQIKGVSHASRDLLKARVSERQAERAKLMLSHLGCPLSVRTEYCDTQSTGSGIMLYAIYAKDEEISAYAPIRIGGDGLGKKGKKAETVGKEAAEKLLIQMKHNAPVDEYLADNMIPLLALYGGTMKVSNVTGHVLSNIYTVEKFMGKIFEIQGNVISRKVH